MKDLATTSRREFIAQIDADDADSVIARIARRNAMKRSDAIQYLGSRWVFHKRYRASDNPHHRPANKESAVLASYIVARGAHAEGRLPVTYAPPKTESRAACAEEAYEFTERTARLMEIQA